MPVAFGKKPQHPVDKDEQDSKQDEQACMDGTAYSHREEQATPPNNEPSITLENLEDSREVLFLGSFRGSGKREWA